MKTVLNLLGIIGALCMLLGFVMLDSTGLFERISIVLSLVGLALVMLWVETEGRRWA